MDFLLTKACCVSDDVMDDLNEELRKEKYIKCNNYMNCTPNSDGLYQGFNNLNRRNIQKEEITNSDFSHYFKIKNTIDFREAGFSKKELILLDKMIHQNTNNIAVTTRKVPDDENKEQD